MAILMRGGYIAAIGPDVAARDASVLDAGGATVLPGLIDAHVHLGVVPGSGQRRDTPDLRRNLRRQHLCAYLACGVTTILDTHIDPEVAHGIQAWLAAGHPGPRFLTLGPGFVTPGGYLSLSSASARSNASVAGSAGCAMAMSERRPCARREKGSPRENLGHHAPGRVVVQFQPVGAKVGLALLRGDGKRL